MAYTIEQLAAALEKADAAGDEQSAQAIAAAIRQQQQTAAVPAGAVAAVAPLQRPSAEQSEQSPYGEYAPALERLRQLPSQSGLRRQAGLTARAIGGGLAQAVAPFTEPVRYLANKALPGNPVGGIEETVEQLATQAGLPEASTPEERRVQSIGKFAAGVGAGGAIQSAAARSMGLAATTTASRATSKAPRAAARVLEDSGVPLDQSQRTGGRFAQMMRGAVTNHPATAGAQAEFSAAQQKAFNRAVLRSVGENSDEATQAVMRSAKTRIGAMFDRVGQKGAVFDDALQGRLADIVDDAHRTVTEDGLRPLLRNVDDLLDAVDDAGRINGDKLIQVRARLSRLSKTSGIGPAARELHDELIAALERTHPGEKRLLQDAVDQWRNLRIIEQSVSKGATRDISPSRLANVIGTKQNRAMSVYGQGGDQGLVELAQAGKEVLPQALPDSGTVPRGLMQAPLRAVATAPLYKAGQIYLNSAKPPRMPVSLPARIPQRAYAASAIGMGMRDLIGTNIKTELQPGDESPRRSDGR